MIIFAVTSTIAFLNEWRVEETERKIERFENVHATRKFVYKTSTNTKSNKINQKLKRNSNRKFIQINTNNHMHTETVKLTVVLSLSQKSNYKDFD